ncbi:uncharacterized protein [Parasteatoda tepidariorum]|uniref:uncharacterized protein isoform X2 n=1 Tax=Parasteatoda tepidariorum TaxID=114398 RepID=UPI001C71CE4B|nr:uncharacterized protein LOC107456727 isoform X2 [Parasteatoda tepidariorum]
MTNSVQNVEALLFHLLRFLTSLVLVYCCFVVELQYLMAKSINIAKDRSFVGKMETTKTLRNFDPDTINRLLMSMGHLKFSLRSLASEGVCSEDAVLATEECESFPCDVPIESNKILEKAISEIASTPENSDAKCAKIPNNKTSIENLQIVRDKLRKELKNIRLYHQSILSEKLEEKNNLTS